MENGFITKARCKMPQHTQKFTTDLLFVSPLVSFFWSFKWSVVLVNATCLEFIQSQRLNSVFIMTSLNQH
ncbi:CLUMA_CG010253, isoform A [Clunio marinus]|uniref:CLUMA_CG010253, isoform A n=1 Tax=Clunio marinus TaxID=568069 RepID=A0A1J1I851_9DIPT|nr:CLUMA_CG010253, isoform A [Clunio marinus]